MTPIEIMALIVALFTAIKLILVLINPQIWYNTVTKRSWASPIRTSIVTLILAIIVLIFLLQELTIIQIMAAGLLVMLLLALGFAPFSKDMLVLEKKMFKEWKKGWLPTIVWAALAIWVLYALFA